MAKKNKDLFVFALIRLGAAFALEDFVKLVLLLHLSFNNLRLSLTHTHTRSHFPFNVCLLKCMVF